MCRPRIAGFQLDNRVNLCRSCLPKRLSSAAHPIFSIEDDPTEFSCDACGHRLKGPPRIRVGQVAVHGRAG